jgi:aldehyde:ferredoxin oxidoreductase
MGSKLLKAIVISGQGGPVPLADASKFVELALEYRPFVKSSPIVDTMGYGGCIRNYGALSKRMLLAFKNYTDELGQLDWGREMDETMAMSKLIPRPCFNCPIGCAQDIIIGKGLYKGYRSRMGGGGQWEGLAGAIGVMEGSTVIYLTDLLNELGCEAGIVGQRIALLYDCYERGLIDKEFTDGLELKWGNADAAIKLLDKYIRKEGVGQLIAKGQKEIAKIIGKGSDQLLSGYKGIAIHHDHRASWELLLGRVTSSTTATEGLGFDNWSFEPDLGHPERLKPFDRDRAPKNVGLTQIKSRWDNCLGVCIFSLVTISGSLNKYTPMALKYAVGWDFNRDEAWLVGERVTNIARIFSLRRGLTKEDDMDIGPIFLNGFKKGEFKDKPIRPHLSWMVSKYYEYMGWDPEMGIPSEDTLKRLRMEEMIEDVRDLRKARERN